MITRRQFIKKGAAVTAVAVGSVSAGAAESKSKATEKNQSVKQYAPMSLEPEFQINGNKIDNNQQQRFAFSKCFGCFDICGVRARIDNATDTVVRVCGNPYIPANQAGNPLDLSVNPKDAALLLSEYQEHGMKRRATLCARGNAVLDAYKDPHRVTKCLKRTGKRGENKWATITYEQLIDEVIAGGDLFGEGHVDGLAAINNHEKLANKDYPDFGPVANQLLIGYNSEKPARTDFMVRFAENVWGTVNKVCKNAYCGHQQVAGSALGCFDGTEGADLPIIDYQNCDFGIYIGTSPGNSGNSINSYGRRMAILKSERGSAKFVVVSPVLRSIASEAAKKNFEWLPIRAGGDTFMIFGIMQYIINNDRYNAKFLKCPNQDAAKQAGEVNYTNATYLVVQDENHALAKKFLTANLLGIGGDKDKVVVDEQTGQLVSANSCPSAKLLYSGALKLNDGTTVNVKTSFLMLKERVNERTPAQYSEGCDIPVKTIKYLAQEFTSHGRRVGIETNTGCNSTDGGMVAFCTIVLMTLVGVHNAKGGMLHSCNGGYGDSFPVNEKPKYNFMDFDKREATGFPAERSGKYEESHEYKQKIAKGLPPYPADQAWTCTIEQENAGEALIAHANKNPFPFKVWINWAANPLYNCSGLYDQVIDSIKDPKKLGLFIAVDPFINETNINADYIVPDVMQYEEWENARSWGSDYLADVIAVPIIEPRTDKNKKNQHICMEQFLIDIAKKLNLPGLGKNAFKDCNGVSYDINCPEDYFVRRFANVAFTGTVCPSPTAEDIEFTSVDRIMPLLKSKLKPEEIGPTAFMLTRGGKYENIKERYNGNFFSSDLMMEAEFQLYNEGLSLLIDSYSGKRYDGLPVCDVDRFWDGTPIREKWSTQEYPFYFSTFKPQLRSPYSVMLPRIVELGQTNSIVMNKQDAQDLGLKNGDVVGISSPKGVTITGILDACDTVAKSNVAISTGFGHSAFGAIDMIVDNNIIPAVDNRKLGTAVNAFNIVDPTRKGASLYRDKLFGCTARHGVPVKVFKI